MHKGYGSALDGMTTDLTDVHGRDESGLVVHVLVAS